MAFYPGTMEIAPFELIAFISPRALFAQLLPIEEGDSALATFSIAQDLKKRIPMIKKAATMIDDDFVFYASPWSPKALTI